jgi:hypothetical protein
VIDDDVGRQALLRNLPPIAIARSVAMPISSDNVALPVQTVRVALQGYDPNGDPLTFDIATPPLRGTATVTGSVLSYTAVRWGTVVGGSPYTGAAERISVRARDGSLASAPVDIVVNVSGFAACEGLTCGNVPPEITTNRAFFIDLRLGAPTGDLLDRLEAFDANRDPLRFTAVTAPAGLTVDPLTGVIRWTATRLNVGDNPLVIEVSDGRAAPARFTRFVRVTSDGSNARPMFTSTPVLATFGAYSYDADAVDPEGLVVVYSLDIAPPGVIVNPLTGLVSGTPPIGAHAVTVRATDVLGAFTQQAFVIVAYGPGPTITSLPLGSATEDVLYSYDAAAVHLVPGEPLTWSIASGPTGMTIDAASGLVSWTPAATDVGPVSVRIAVSDSSGASQEQPYTLGVLSRDQAPRIVTGPVIAARAGDVYVYNVDATDPSLLDVLTFELAKGPSGMTISPLTGVVQWSPSTAGTYPVDVIVRDLSGRTDRQFWSVVVSP